MGISSRVSTFTLDSTGFTIGSIVGISGLNATSVTLDSVGATLVSIGTIIVSPSTFATLASAGVWSFFPANASSASSSSTASTFRRRASRRFGDITGRRMGAAAAFSCTVLNASFWPSVRIRSRISMFFGRPIACFGLITNEGLGADVIVTGVVVAGVVVADVVVADVVMAGIVVAGVVVTSVVMVGIVMFGVVVAGVTEAFASPLLPFGAVAFFTSPPFPLVVSLLLATTALFVAVIFVAGAGGGTSGGDNGMACSIIICRPYVSILPMFEYVK
ncbi:hypothetical protein BC936DRAFT_149252 [Jimgerdemannia flammicorona]|uniref:Uncharacterized protein n=1 Tax=Jimgerdemannia flammicorona TaxID=994334 RepID=A0A433DK80_9FUNG|nr:hypothetical protein BC936DRAFT_149252 [Jimgerdemannia flammicorona]